MVWGFQCTCSLCSSEPSRLQESEVRIQRVVELQNALADWSPGSEDAISMAEELILLYEHENIHAAICTGHMFAALAYNAVGDVEGAKRHAVLGIENGLVTSGAKYSVDELNALRENPKGHWSYMVRKAKGGR